MQAVLFILAFSTVFSFGCLAQKKANSSPMQLREVDYLARVPLPPGGLIPYRAGKLWGYADTTGRMVIQPGLRHKLLDTASVSETVIFTHDFALLPAALEVATLAEQRGASYRAVILNARGEVLRVRWWEAALLLADSSLRRVPRWQVYGQWEWGNQRPFEAENGFSTGGPIRIVPTPQDEPSRPATDSAYYEARLLGNRRGTRADLPLGMVVGTDLRYRPRTQGLFALTDQQGRLLTSYRFALIDDFREGFARVVFPRWQAGKAPERLPADRALRPSFGNSRIGYLDTTGHLLKLPPLLRGSIFRHGRAVISRDSSYQRYAIIDLKGNYQLTWQARRLSDPDEAGFVRILDEPKTQFRYIPPPGKRGFSSFVFQQAGPFRNGRAWVQQGTRQGLVNEKGRWVTPVSYDQLISPSRLRSYRDDAQREQMDETYGQFFDRGWPAIKSVSSDVPAGLTGIAPRYPAADTAYLIARRKGAYGVVARHTGREVVPARYDSVLLNPCRGIACLWRGGQPYVIAVAKGRELITGLYEGIDFVTPSGRLLYLTRTAPATWALSDTTGRLHTPWLAGTGYPTPGGRLLSQEPDGVWTLRDSTGRLEFTSPFPLVHPQASAVWEQIRWEKERHVPGTEVATAYWRLPLPHGLARENNSSGYIVQEPKVVRWLDPALREVKHATTVSTNIVACGWGYRHEGLISSTGQFIAADAKAPWLLLQFFDYDRAWSRHGVLPTAYGFRTRGGRNLWQ